MFFYKSEKKHVFNVFFICKSMFLTSMTYGTCNANRLHNEILPILRLTFSSEHTYLLDKLEISYSCEHCFANHLHFCRIILSAQLVDSSANRQQRYQKVNSRSQ